MRVCKGLPFALHAQRGGMPPQVPRDAHAASKVEEPVAAAAALGSLGSESQDSRHVQTDSEVPELCALMVCCYALRVFHRVLSGLLQVPTAVGSTRNLPPPTVSSQRHLPVNAFLDTTRARWITLELFGRPFPQIVSEHDRTQAQE